MEEDQIEIVQEVIEQLRDHEDGQSREFKQARKALKNAIRHGIEPPAAPVKWASNNFSLSGMNKVAVMVIFNQERHLAAGLVFDDQFVIGSVRPET
ncbi:hypothetical protein PG985_012642 [Apiospora marii]|uniref:Uncharacterized protein n=1 Tax=Apiospora marii TaxID=335849 RepID=A0ABR1RCT6_9PEZI